MKLKHLYVIKDVQTGNFLSTASNKVSIEDAYIYTAEELPSAQSKAYYFNQTVEGLSFEQPNRYKVVSLENVFGAMQSVIESEGLQV